VSLASLPPPLPAVGVPVPLLFATLAVGVGGVVVLALHAVSARPSPASNAMPMKEIRVVRATTVFMAARLGRLPSGCLKVD
jgi:hypothetical protein